MNRPFNLEAALNGETVVSTGCSFSAKYVFKELAKIHDRVALKFVAAPGETHGCEFNATLDGKSAYYPNEAYQLVMAPRKMKKTKYVNLYISSGEAPLKGMYHDTEERAREMASQSWEAFAIAAPVEIEVEE